MAPDSSPTPAPTPPATRQRAPALALATVFGVCGGYFVKPSTVTIPPPPPTVEGGLVCQPFGDQLPDGGFLELCRAASAEELDAGPGPAAP